MARQRHATADEYGGDLVAKIRDENANRLMQLQARMRENAAPINAAAQQDPALAADVARADTESRNFVAGRTTPTGGYVVTPGGELVPTNSANPGDRARWAINALTGMGMQKAPETIDPHTGQISGVPAGGGNYWDKLIGAAYTGTSHLPEPRLPEAHSMIGNAGGDAAGQIAEARSAAGPNPLEDYISPAYKAAHPQWGDVQEGRYQDYQKRVGSELAGITGFDEPYNPESGGKEQREIQGAGLTDEEIANRKAWLDQMRAFHGGG
jgi:hypothetical protein